MKILIAGAGIGGLTAGLCLAQAGHEVQIVEQAPELSEVGAGLQCGANAVHVLESLGLLDRIDSVAVRPHRVEFRDYLSGAALHRMDLGNSYQQRYGAPYLHIHRADLQRALYESAQQNLKISFEFGRSAELFTEVADAVTIELDDGQQLNGDCLIGADGIRSKIREQVLGVIEPVYTGYVAWRGVVPRQRLPKDFMDTIVSNFVGPDKHMVVYYLRGGQLVNFVGVVENREWRDVSWVANAPWEDFRDDFQGWHSTVESLVHAVDKDQCYRWALCDHQAFSNWSTDRVTLLGDAAHATLPFMASGAAMAIEDARILQRALEQEADVSQALRRYQRHRLPRTAKIQSSSAQLGRIYHLRSRLAMKAAFKAISVIGRRREAFLPDYNANTIEF